MTNPANRAFRLRMAKQTAEALLRDEGIITLPVDPFAIAASRNIEVKSKPDTAEGVSGMLLRHGDNFGILYATHIPSEGFQRFSIAHELGHYFLDGHVDHILPKDGLHISHAGFVSADPYELEAYQFAAGLLMPSVPFRPLLSSLWRRGRPALSDVQLPEVISNKCIHSLMGSCRGGLNAGGQVALYRLLAA
jgi:IrrE N-terminal-like domain